MKAINLLSVLGFMFFLATSQIRAESVYDKPQAMYDFLAGEIAAGQGQLQKALDHLFSAAQILKKSEIARRATQIGLHLNTDQALKAATLWTELAPKELEAWRTLLLLQIKFEKSQSIATSLDSLMHLAKDSGKDGFMQVALICVELPKSDYARKVMENLVAENKDNAKAQYALGVALYGLQDETAAEKALRISLKLDTKQPSVWLMLSRIAEMQSRTEESEQILKEGLGHLPDNQLLNLALAERLLTHEKLKQAYERFIDLYKRYPDNDEIAQAAGGLAVELKHWEQAREIWEKQVERDGDKHRVNYFLGMVEKGSGNTRKARQYLERVKGILEIDAQVAIAGINAAEGDIARVQKNFARLRMLSKDNVIRLYLLEVNLLTEHDKDLLAMELLDSALEQHPDNSELLYARAMIGERMGNIGLLERDLRQLLQKEPEHAQALNALGYTLADETTRYDEAYELISKAYKLEPDSAAILDSMGWVLFRLGRFEEALDFLNKAASRDDDSEIAAHLGEVLWKLGKIDQAQKIWKDALERDPDAEYINNTIKRYLP